jgi:hypothetical protein
MPSGLWKAAIDAILGQTERYAGQAITELTTPLAIDEVATANVASTIRFGVEVDDTTISVLLIGGEIVLATGRTLTSFTTLSRGYRTTAPRLHPPGTLVYDLTRNRTALDLVRRGFFVRTARLEDLDVIGRNLGLHKCPGLDEETWRALIQVMAYLPNQPIDAFKRVLDVFPGIGNYEIVEDLITNPSQVFVFVNIPTSNSLRGKFFLNGGEPQVADGAGLTVTTTYPINNVLGVFDDDSDTRRGNRDGRTNYLNPGGTFLGSVITLGTPVGAAAPLIVDYGAFEAHYLAEDETVRYPADGDFFPYLSDPSAIVQCLLDQVRAAGVRVIVTATLV